MHGISLGGLFRFLVFFFGHAHKNPPPPTCYLKTYSGSSSSRKVGEVPKDPMAQRQGS